MKTLLIGLAILSIAGAASAQSFSDVSLQREGAIDRVQFTVPAEANIRYYLLEGSRDSSAFNILKRIDSRGNSVLPQSYSGLLRDTTYAYYRIRQVDMSAVCGYSECIAAKKPVLPVAVPQVDQPAVTTNVSAPCTAMSTVCGK